MKSKCLHSFTFYFKIHFFMHALCVLLAAGLLSGCATVKKDPALVSKQLVHQNGQILASDGSASSMQAVVAEAKDASYILIGERHDRQHHHEMQAEFLDAFAAAGYTPLVGLEMVPAQAQPKLDDFNYGRVPLHALNDALAWEKTWGYKFELYEPVFSSAERNSIPVYGLNVPQPLVRKVAAAGGTGKLTAAEKRLLPKKILPPPAEQLERLRQVYMMHEDMRRGITGQQSVGAMTQAFDRFILVQSLWDTAMAERAVELRKKNKRPVVILAGSGHVEYGYGIASRLAQLDAGAKSLLIMPINAQGLVALLADEQGHVADATGYGPQPQAEEKKAPAKKKRSKKSRKRAQQAESRLEQPSDNRMTTHATDMPHDAHWQKPASPTSSGQHAAVAAPESTPFVHAVDREVFVIGESQSVRRSKRISSDQTEERPSSRRSVTYGTSSGYVGTATHATDRDSSQRLSQASPAAETQLRVKTYESTRSIAVQSEHVSVIASDVPAYVAPVQTAPVPVAASVSVPSDAVTVTPAVPVAPATAYPYQAPVVADSLVTRPASSVLQSDPQIRRSVSISQKRTVYNHEFSGVVTESQAPVSPRIAPAAPIAPAVENAPVLSVNAPVVQSTQVMTKKGSVVAVSEVVQDSYYTTGVTPYHVAPMSPAVSTSVAEHTAAPQTTAMQNEHPTASAQVPAASAVSAPQTVSYQPVVSEAYASAPVPALVGRPVYAQVLVSVPLEGSALDIPVAPVAREPVAAVAPQSVGGESSPMQTIAQSAEAIAPVTSSVGVENPATFTQESHTLPKPSARMADFFYYSMEESTIGTGLSLFVANNKVMVEGVRPGSLADRAGIRQGDCITKMNSQPLPSLAAMHTIAAQAKQTNTPLIMEIERQGRFRSVRIDLNSPS